MFELTEFMGHLPRPSHDTDYANIELFAALPVGEWQLDAPQLILACGNGQQPILLAQVPQLSPSTNKPKSYVPSVVSRP